MATPPRSFVPKWHRHIELILRLHLQSGSRSGWPKSATRIPVPVRDHTAGDSAPPPVHSAFSRRRDRTSGFESSIRHRERQGWAHL